jgi:hypothetical protein
VLSDFQFDEADPLSKDGVNSGKICTRRDTGKQYVVKSQRAYAGSVWTEQAIIECLTELSLPFLPHMRWSFQNGEHMYMITVSFRSFYLSHCKIIKIKRITTPMVDSSTSSINMVH